MKEIVVTNQAIPAKGRSKNYRNTVGQVVLNGGGSATQTVVSTGGTADEASIGAELLRNRIVPASAQHGTHTGRSALERGD